MRVKNHIQICLQIPFHLPFPTVDVKPATWGWGAWPCVRCGSRLRLWVQVVQLLLSSNMCATMLEPKPSDPNGVSPLHLAAKNGHIDVIRWEHAPPPPLACPDIKEW